MSTSDGLTKDGKRLYSALSGGSDDVARDALALETARISDRLDELDRIIAGRGVLELMQFRLKDSFDDDEGRSVLVEVKFDNVLGEARQQANVLRQMLVSLGLGQVVTKAEPQRSSILDELAKRRAGRAAGA